MMSNNSHLIDMAMGDLPEQLKKIGREARTKIEELSGGSVYLDLWIKVKEKWRKNDAFLKMVGYNPEVY